MRDGAPNGYAIVTFDGHRASVAFKAAGEPATKQMHVMLPDSIAASSAAPAWLYVNVFNGSERSQVEFQLDRQGPWIPLSQSREPDPSYLARKAAEELDPPAIPPFRKMGDPIKSPHLWKALLPPLSPGQHSLEVRTRDLHGRSFAETHTLTVKP